MTYETVEAPGRASDGRQLGFFFLVSSRLDVSSVKRRDSSVAENHGFSWFWGPRVIHTQ